MKRKVYTSSFSKRILLAVGIVSLPLLLTNQVQAKAPGTASARLALVIVAAHDLSGIDTTSQAELKSRLLYLMARNSKAVRVISKGCGCSAAQAGAGSGFGGCLKACMADMGISPYAIVMCGVACAAAETGIGALACAVCVGVAATVIEVCALGCATYGSGGGGRGQVLGKLLPHPVPRQLRLQPARGRSD